MPDHLPRVPTAQALATVTLPVALNWSQPGRRFDLARRPDRARVYEAVLQEGTDDDIISRIDGTLLIDLWSELVLPQVLRRAWDPLICAQEQR